MKKLYNESIGTVNQTGMGRKLGGGVGSFESTSHDFSSQFSGQSGGARTLLLIVFVIVAFVVLATIAFKARTSASFARMAFLPVPVGGYKVKVEHITDTVGASGLVQEHSTVYITSRVNATVKDVLVKIGDVIQKGTPLLNLDQNAYGPALVAAKQAEIATKSDVAKYNAQYNAEVELRKQGLASDLDIQSALAAQAMANKVEAEAEKEVVDDQTAFDFTTYKSPLIGIVIARNADPGDTLIIDHPVFTLGVLDTVYFVALIQENELPYLTPNTKAEVIYSSLPSRTFHGIVEKIGPTIDPTTRTFTAYIAIDNPGLLLKPGITGFGRITIERTALAVPESAVMNQYGETANVFIVNKDSRAVLTPVVLGLAGDNCYEVVSGLKEGDVVVSVGTLYLKDNERVHVNFRDSNS